MRPQNKSRSRNKNNNGNNQRRNAGNTINRVFDSAGPDGKVRGTPQQIIDKYQILARDAQLSGDRVAAESFLQHSEHYARLLGQAMQQQQEQRQAQEAQREEQQQRENQRREEQQRSQNNAKSNQNDQPSRDPEAIESTPQTGTEGSGLTMIDTSDDAQDSGPVETPESSRKPRKRARASAPAPEAEAPVEANGSAAETPEANGTAKNGVEANGAEAAPAKPARKPRAKRKPKAEPVVEAAPTSDAGATPQAPE